MNPDFFKVTAARFLFSLAVQSQAVLIGWRMYEFTHDPLSLGLVGLAAAVPALSLALFAGALVDRYNPLRFYQGVVGVSLLSVLVSWQARDPAGLYLAALMTGLVRAFSSPSMGSIIPRIITRDEIKRSSAYTALAFQFAGVVGPGLAGVLLSLAGYDYPYLLCVSSLVLASLTLLFLKYRHVPRARPKTRNQGNLRVEAWSALRYVFSHPLLLPSMALDMFAVLFGGVTALLPVFAAEILHVGPTGLGWLRAAPALGAMVMGVFLVRRPVTRIAGRVMMGSIFGFGLCILVFGSSKTVVLSFAALAVSGALDAVSMVIRGAIVQLCSPDEMRGRIAAVSAIFIGSSNEIGEFESGVAARLLGTVPAVFFGGTLTLLTVAITWKRCPELRELDLGVLEKRIT